MPESTAITAQAMRTPEGLRWPVNPIHGAAVIFWWFLRYLAYRVGIGPQPLIRPIFRQGLSFLRFVFRCHDRLRILGEEHCPTHGPAVFAGNHVATFDPFYTLYSIWVASRCGIKTRSMMRDDFFQRMNTRLFDFDEVMHLVGAYPVSRDQVRVTQLKPFVEALHRGEAFFMYPSGTRSRSGAFMELLAGREEPGTVSFFLAQADRRRPGEKTIAVPMARTINVCTGWTTIAFGPPMTLEDNANRAAQRAFDAALIVRMANLLEIHASHALAALLYLAALHGRTQPRPLEALCAEVRTLLDRAGHPLVAPYTESTLARELRDAIRCFSKAGLVREQGGIVHLDTAAILALPEPDLSLWKRHPIRYLVNQSMHLDGFVAAAEALALPEH